jgi:GT2 family glycosyltransferase
VPTPDVLAIIVAHDSAALLPGCVEALAASARTVEVQAVVVDTASRDGCAAVCERLGVRCIEGPNGGMGAAFNRALRSPDLPRARHILQINPDVLFPPGGLDQLVASADARPQCGVLAPRQVDQHGSLVCSIGVEPSPAGYLVAVRDLWCDWDWDTGHYAAPREVDWAMGACMLLRRDMLDAVGGFDERFFLCSEEVDLCRRARAAGWSVWYDPAVTIMHPMADRTLDAHRVRLEEWSRLLYIRKWFAAADRALMRLALAARFARLTLGEAQPPKRREARLRLGATLRFDRRRYGPAP